MIDVVGAAVERRPPAPPEQTEIETTALFTVLVGPGGADDFHQQPFSFLRGEGQEQYNKFSIVFFSKFVIICRSQNVLRFDPPEAGRFHAPFFRNAPLHHGSFRRWCWWNLELLKRGGGLESWRDFGGHKSQLPGSFTVAPTCRSGRSARDLDDRTCFPECS